MVKTEPNVRVFRRTPTTVKINGETYKAMQYTLNVQYTETVSSSVPLLDCPGSFFMSHNDEFRNVFFNHLVIVDPKYWEHYNPATDNLCYDKTGWSTLQG